MKVAIALLVALVAVAQASNIQKRSIDDEHSLCTVSELSSYISSDCSSANSACFTAAKKSGLFSTVASTCYDTTSFNGKTAACIVEDLFAELTDATSSC